jgi:WD40 repeat protein
VLIAAGGGGSMFGVRNKILSYRVENNKFSEQVFQNEFEKEIPVYITAYEKLDMFIVCVDNYCFLYKLNSDGTFKQISKLKVLEYRDQSSYVTVCKFDDKAELLATGTSDGLIKSIIFKSRLWKTDEKFEEFKLIKEQQAHSRDINEFIFLNDKLVSASSDGTARIFELATLKFLKFLSFRVEEKERNYSFRAIRHDKYNNCLISIQTPKEGNTYIIKWDIRNFSPISTVCINNSVITSVDFSEKYGILGLGDRSGKIFFYDSSSLVKLGEKVIGEMTVKSVSFKGNYLICGSADNALILSDIVRGNSISITFILKLVFLVLFVLYILNKKNNI